MDKYCRSRIDLLHSPTILDNHNDGMVSDPTMHTHIPRCRIIQMTNYSRGRQTEYKCIKEIEVSGGKAWRTAGSHGPFDIIALLPTDGKIHLIQIKREKKNQKLKYESDIKKLIQDVGNGRIGVCDLWVWKDRKGFTRIPLY